MPSNSDLGTTAPEKSAAFEAKRMDILRQCALAFAKDGYHQTTVNSLATRLGVSKPVLYYYAKNKDDLLFQCGEIARDALRDAMKSADRSKISGIGKIRHFFTAYTEIMAGDFGRCLVLGDINSLSPETRAKDAATRREIEGAVCNLIRAGQADGSVAHCNPVLAARALFGAFNGIPRWFRPGGEFEAKDIAEAYIDMFVTGIGRG